MLGISKDKGRNDVGASLDENGLRGLKASFKRQFRWFLIQQKSHLTLIIERDLILLLDFSGLT